MKQQIIWTVLPNGIDNNNMCKLSILVSPRLETPKKTTLSDFTDFRIWPEKILTFDLKFVSVPTGKEVNVKGVTPSKIPYERRKLWTAAFPDYTTINSYSFNKNYSGLNVHSFPMLNVLSFITEQYKNIASNADGLDRFPSAEQLRKTLQDITFDIHTENRYREILNDHLQNQLDPEHPMPKQSTTLDFFQLKNILEPLNNKSKEFVKFFPEQVPKPDLDFHKALALLGEHSELLRALGLIIDLEISEKIPSSGYVWVNKVYVEPTWETETINLIPKTRYTDDFHAMSKTKNITNGFLQLGNSYGLVELDVEGAAIKLMNLAKTVYESFNQKTSVTPRGFSFPALRSGGLALVQTGRATNLVRSLNKSIDLNDYITGVGSDIISELYAEDLIRGYSVDAKESNNPTSSWQSLCRRRVSYTLGVEGNAFWPIDGTKFDDEGWITLSATSGPNRNESPDLIISEAMFRWDGWSLCARRPGKSVGIDDKVKSFEHETHNFQIRIDSEVMPGSLPKLRFGKSYLIRVRIVDLAGNRIPYTSNNDTTSIGPKLYTRFEPIVHPTVLYKTRAGSGESLERIVIRSFNDNILKDKEITNMEASRHIAPPLGSQLLAEAHGKFDNMTADSSYNMIQSKQGTYGNPDDPEAPDNLHTEEQLNLPYLPDPLVHGAAFLGLPYNKSENLTGLPGVKLNREIKYYSDGTKTITDLSERPPITLIKVDFGSIDKWPDLNPFSILITEGYAEPIWDNTTRQLTVFLPKAETTKVRLSSYIDQDALAQLGIWQWIEENKPPISELQKNYLRRLATQGRHWMLTPFRELILIHAVQQPLLTPDISKLSINRLIGSTATKLEGLAEVHAKSTIKLDFNAEWSEYIDSINKPKFAVINGAAHAFEVPINYPGFPEKQSDNTVIVKHLHELGDTKHREVWYTAVATTRYQEYFDDEKLIFTRSSEKIRLEVPSSARPGAPQILYVVPTFGWSRPPVTQNEMQSTRYGGGLRVYLERPWFSSGDGELLGVVLPMPSRGINIIADELKPYVTQWGGDPTAASTVNKPILSASDFTLAIEKRENLTLDELEGTDYTVAVAAHAVEYDERRQLWYCDIELNPGPAYFPFVRLALARYQPFSVEQQMRGGIRNVHLSRVVLADFAQLTPERSAIVKYDTKTNLNVSVLGVGIERNIVEVALETQRQDVPTDLGWISIAHFDPIRSPVGTKRFAVTLPEQSGGATPIRLVIREFEEMPTSFEGEKKGKRLVYAEVFPL